MDNNSLKNVFIKTGDSHGNDAKHHSLLDGVSRVVKNFAFASSFFLMGTVSDYSHAEEARDVPYTMNQPARSIFKCSQNSIEREAYFVANATTGDMILEHDGDVLIQPASMTKLMTLLLTHEAEKEGLDSDTTLYFSQSQKNARPYDDIFGHWGGAIRLGEAKKATALSSYNDIAFLLAENVAKFKEVGNTETHFVRLMNQRAQELGMDNTFFYNSNGMPTPPCPI